jgi:hypothetical protein
VEEGSGHSDDGGYSSDETVRVEDDNEEVERDTQEKLADLREWLDMQDAQISEERLEELVEEIRGTSSKARRTTTVGGDEAGAQPAASSPAEKTAPAQQGTPRSPPDQSLEAAQVPKAPGSGPAWSRFERSIERYDIDDWTHCWSPTGELYVVSSEGRWVKTRIMHNVEDTSTWKCCMCGRGPPRVGINVLSCSSALPEQPGLF